MLFCFAAPLAVQAETKSVPSTTAQQTPSAKQQLLAALRADDLQAVQALYSDATVLCKSSFRRGKPAERVLLGTLMREAARYDAAQVAALPMTTLADAFAQVADDCPEKDTLIRLFTHLGHGSKECRVLAVEQAAEEIRLLAQSAAAKADKDAKLWQTLGFTGGICLTILLL